MDYPSVQRTDGINYDGSQCYMSSKAQWKEEGENEERVIEDDAIRRD